MTKILIIQTAYIGDSILSTVLIKPLREKFEHSEIHILTTNALAPIFELTPVDKIHIIDKRHSSLTAQLRLAKKLRLEKFDIVLLPHRSMRSAILAFLSGAKIRIGFALQLKCIFFTHCVKYDMTKHEAQRFLELLEPLGIDTEVTDFPFLPDRQNDDAMRKTLPKNYIVIAPGSVWFTKRWPIAYFSELAGYFINDRQHVVLIGAASETELCEEIVKNNDSQWIYNLCGKTDLQQFFIAVKHARFVVTNDSSPVHVASAVGTPAAVILGSTVSEFGFGPLAQGSIAISNETLSCRPCSIHGLNACPKKHFKCMLELTPKKVYSIIKENFV